MERPAAGTDDRRQPLSAGYEHRRRRIHRPQCGEPPPRFLAGLCYTLGRILACTALGIALIPLLRRGASLFAVERLLARYGEVLLPATLLLFGVLLLFGDRLSLPLRGGSGRKVLRCNGCGGALLLGILFSLTFCPTSALLYFGMLLPMAAAERPGGCCPHSMLRLRDCRRGRSLDSGIRSLRNRDLLQPHAESAAGTYPPGRRRHDPRRNLLHRNRNPLNGLTSKYRHT